MKEILQYLEMHGERLDTEIAVATGTALADVYLHLSHLVAGGDVVVSRSVRFEKRKRVGRISCRLPRLDDAGANEKRYFPASVYGSKR